MSSKPTVPDSALQQLAAAGFDVEVRHQHLLVHQVPYVNEAGVVKRGTVICKYVESGGQLLPPNANHGDSHQIWWQGEYPCYADRRRLAELENENQGQELFPGCIFNYRFSNKPVGVDHFQTHVEKVMHYINLIQAQAGVLEPWSRAQAGGVKRSEDESVFQYPDSASARAEILMTSAQLAIGKVAIVGLGGTGSYVLDQLAKTPVPGIDLFDGDLFEQHSAFRSPGAATEAEIDARLPKVEIYKRRYSAMHRGIVSHPYFLDDANIAELADFSFVFVCVDRADARRLIFRFLQSCGIPFIDVGMNLQQVKGSLRLIGSCRATLVTPQLNDHVDNCVPLADGDEDALYRQNIQVADMNALNAQMAVMLWKQYCGFYQADFATVNMLFSVNQNMLAKTVAGVGDGDEG
jgi:molybdopterin/thiamine biosynthesis adenylyltransferase